MNVPHFMMASLQQTAVEEPELARQDEAEARKARFAELVERRSRFVFRVCYALLRNPHDAEDAVQEVFLKLYRSGAWERMEDERGFLARTAWRIAQDRLPKRRNAASSPDIASDAASPEDAAIEADQNAVIYRLIDALPQELRQPLALSTVEEMNSRQIAEAMGISEGTVRTRLMRARQILKQRLAALTERRYAK